MRPRAPRDAARAPATSERPRCDDPTRSARAPRSPASEPASDATASRRVHYDWGPAPDHYFGEVHVGDGGGIRFECWTAGLNANLDPRYVALEPPDYFDGCLALVGQEVRLDCLIAGLHIGESFPECPAESG